MSSTSRTTTDHKTIRQWVEAREGCPAHVKSTAGKDDPGLLRIDFEGFSGQDSLEKISWEEFFDKFEESKLAFLYQDETSKGDTSRFFKFVSRDKH